MSVTRVAVLSPLTGEREGGVRRGREVSYLWAEVFWYFHTLCFYGETREKQTEREREREREQYISSM